MRLLLRWLVIAGVIWLVAAIVPGVHVRDGVENYLVVAAIFAIVNVLVGPVLRMVALPFTILTLGLFLLVINAALLGLTARLTDRLDIDGFLTAVIAAFLISVTTSAAEKVFGLDD